MTATALKLSAEGKTSGSIELNESVFGTTPNTHVMHLAVRRELDNGRAGTAKAKTRSEVSGGGKKPWKQKGTGRARAGSIRSPLWKGGGVIFGPKPRSFAFSMPKKMRRVAIKSALSVAAAESKLLVIAGFDFLKEPKTKLMNDFINKAGLDGKKVLVLTDYRLAPNLVLASRNLKELKLRLPSNLSVKDLILSDAIIATEDAIKEITERLSNDV